MRPAGCPLTPSSSLPPLRTIDTLPEEHVFAALQRLTELYCPLSFNLNIDSKKATDSELVDSGYASGAEDDQDADQQALTALRADGFERAFAERWLTGFIARAEELSCLTSDETRERAVEQASCVLESFFASTAEEEQMQEELAHYTRDFSFSVTSDAKGRERAPVKVTLNDGLAGKNSEEPDDVGLQSWGSSIVFSQLMCEEPARFGLDRDILGDGPRIIELGAGTGLVSLVLAKLLPQLDISEPTLVATDYHPAVLANLRDNITTNFSSSSGPIAAPLDWAKPTFEAPLDAPADMLLATDVVYAPEHAVWLRDCATNFLGPDGIFWLFVAVRPNGKFEGVTDTVEAALNADDRPRGADGRRLTISHSERFEKRKGIGRNDESGYRLFRIVWA